MKYTVDCRNMKENKIMTRRSYMGTGAGISTKKTAMQIYNDEIASGKWDIVFINEFRPRDNGIDVINVKTWRKYGSSLDNFIPWESA